MASRTLPTSMCRRRGSSGNAVYSWWRRWRRSPASAPNRRPRRYGAAWARVYAEGVPIVGTDGGVLPHGENAKEFAALVQAGLPALEAIRAATVNAARAFRLDREVGQIKAGYRADIIAVNGDPLHDIQSLSNPIFVMHDGTVVQ